MVLFYSTAWQQRCCCLSAPGTSVCCEMKHRFYVNTEDKARSFRDYCVGCVSRRMGASTPLVVAPISSTYSIQAPMPLLHQRFCPKVSFRYFQIFHGVSSRIHFNTGEAPNLQRTCNNAPCPHSFSPLQQAVGCRVSFGNMMTLVTEYF